MYETQRQATATLEYILTPAPRPHAPDAAGHGRHHHARRATWCELARATGQETALAMELLDNAGGRCRHAQRAHRRAVPLRAPAAVRARGHARRRSGPASSPCINRMRRAGFMVGVLSDSYFVAAEIVRRRIFADFAPGPHAAVRRRRLQRPAAAEPGLSAAGRRRRARRSCKSHVIRRLRADEHGPPLLEVLGRGRQPQRPGHAAPGRPRLCHRTQGARRSGRARHHRHPVLRGTAAAGADSLPQREVA